MPELRTQRLRDPVHGLIVFRKEDPVDMLAWKLIDTPEFQRLRRIKQLGLSESVFPGATHTRFAHSIGVFHTARALSGIIRRELQSANEMFDEHRAKVAILAALLHDVGHGPFSHTFEQVEKKRDATKFKRHEVWTAEIIRNKNGKIHEVLGEELASEVSALLVSEEPVDIYHAVVSSSFDADRLDYLRRDRLMTGTGAGAIDFDWLMEHVRVRSVSIEPADEDTEEAQDLKVQTFCIDAKALPAAEQFLLSRYTLHEQVYFHKTTRCVQAMVAALLARVAEKTPNKKTASKETGLPSDHPILRFYSKDGVTVENYLALDDIVVLGSLERMQTAGDAFIKKLSGRILNRQLYKTLDVRFFGSDEGKQKQRARRIDQTFEQQIKDGIVIKDEQASLSIYTQIGGDDDKMHKKLRILEGNNQLNEITGVSDVIRALKEGKRLTRYYFLNEDDRKTARGTKGDK